MRSLRSRVMVSAAVILAAFILLTGIALEQAFRESARSAREEKLLGQLYLLMAAAEAEDETLRLPNELAEPRLGLPGSGLYAAILNSAGRPIWRSASSLGVEPPLEGPLPPGERHFELRRNAAGHEYLVERFGVRWVTGTEPVHYTFAIAEDLGPYRLELTRFRTSLAAWLGAMALLMLAALLIALRWGLTPVRRVSAELAALESGAGDQIQGDYPEELRALTDNLNALLAHERARQRRLDNALGDLAHSLKTPLAVMRSLLDPQRMESATAELIDEQVARMDHIVAYQLQRARSRTGAAAGLSPPVQLRALTSRITASLDKVYRDKDISSELRIDPNLTFRGVEGDLMDVVGNLLENAYKWARHRVQVKAATEHGRVVIEVEDDGPGIPADQARRVLGRGFRADQAAPGYGIGLAVVRDVCEAYGGGIEIGSSPLGGTLVRVRLGE